MGSRSRGSASGLVGVGDQRAQDGADVLDGGGGEAAAGRREDLFAGGWGPVPYGGGGQVGKHDPADNAFLAFDVAAGLEGDVGQVVGGEGGDGSGHGGVSKARAEDGFEFMRFGAGVLNVGVLKNSRRPPGSVAQLGSGVRWGRGRRCGCRSRTRRAGFLR